MPGGGAAPRGDAPRQPVDAVDIGPADYDAFEKTLKAVNDAWDREDMAAMRGLVTPEMISCFGEDIARNQARGAS